MFTSPNVLVVGRNLPPCLTLIGSLLGIEDPDDLTVSNCVARDYADICLVLPSPLSPARLEKRGKPN
jgi:hypothetical protein